MRIFSLWGHGWARERANTSFYSHFLADEDCGNGLAIEGVLFEKITIF